MSEYTHHSHDPHGGAQNGNSVPDPVCGMEVTPGAETPQAPFDGQTFHFCSAARRDKFTAAPWFYASGNAAKRDAPASPQPF